MAASRVQQFLEQAGCRKRAAPADSEQPPAAKQLFLPVYLFLEHGKLEAREVRATEQAAALSVLQFCCNPAWQGLAWQVVTAEPSLRPVLGAAVLGAGAHPPVQPAALGVQL